MSDVNGTRSCLRPRRWPAAVTCGSPAHPTEPRLAARQRSLHSQRLSKWPNLLQLKGLRRHDFLAELGRDPGESM